MTPVALLDGGVEGIEIQMGDGQIARTESLRPRLGTMRWCWIRLSLNPSRVLPMNRYPVPLLLALLLLSLAGCGPATESPNPDAGYGQGATEAEGPTTLDSTDQFQAVSDDLGPREEMPGAALYAEHCALCHEGGVSKSPHLAFLEMMTPKAVYASMTDGIMQPQSAHLSDEQRTHIAEYITRARLDAETVAARAPACTGEEAAFDRSRPVPKVGWGHDHPPLCRCQLGRVRSRASRTSS